MSHAAHITGLALGLLLGVAATWVVVRRRSARARRHDWTPAVAPQEHARAAPDHESPHLRLEWLSGASDSEPATAPTAAPLDVFGPVGVEGPAARAPVPLMVAATAPVAAVDTLSFGVLRAVERASAPHIPADIQACIDRLPVLSPAAAMTLRVLDNPGSPAREVARMILTDPVITTRILRLANSTYYGAGRRVTTVSDAVSLLGFRGIRSLVVTAAVHPVLYRPLPGYGLQQSDIWRHSAGVAACCQHLARLVRYPSSEEAFIAGLIHDIGKVALGQAAGEHLHKVLARVRSGEADLLQAEQEELGVGHDDVGAMMARKWGFPPSLELAISHHHRWDPRPACACLTALTHLGNCVWRAVEAGDGDALWSQVDDRAAAAVGLTEADLGEVVVELTARPPLDLIRVSL